MTMTRACATMFVAAALATTASAQYGNQEKLEVGSDAPEITIQEWVKGDAIEKLEEGQVYVVEFWATWCGPCIANIPHLSELQEQYGDEVIFIGVSDEEVSTVKPFVDKQGDRMAYTVAVDRNRQTNRDWMAAAGQNGIPCAFIVNAEKKIAFIGHPGSKEFEQALAGVADGRYDPKLEEIAKPMFEQVEYSRKMRDWPVCERYLDQIIELKPYVFNKTALKKFRILLLDKGSVEDAIAYAQGDFLATYGDDIETLGMLSEMILTDAQVQRVAPDKLKPLALEIAMAGTDEADPDSLRVLAMALHHNGQVQEAIDVQKRAYFIAEPEDKAEFKRVLDSYNAAIRNEAGRRIR